MYAIGLYAEEDRALFALAVWMKNKWRGMEEVKGLKTPVTLVAIPKILGQKDLRFILKRVTDDAKRTA